MWRLFLVLIGLTAVSCSKPEVKQKNTLYLNLATEPDALDPRLARSLKDLTLVKQLFEGLTRLDKNNVAKPALAEKITISEDGLTYTFYLRDAKWSDGSTIKATDFLYAWKKVLTPSFASDYTHMLYPIKNAKKVRMGSATFEECGVKALDDKTLVVQLENPTPYFLELTAFPTLFPIKEGIDEENAHWSLISQAFVSNGPFLLKKWEPHNEMLLEKNPLYWDEGAVCLSQINLSMIADGATESYLFDKGELDWLGQPLSLPIFKEHLTKLKKEGKIFSYPVAGTFWLKFNTQKEPFDDPLMRKALAYATSRAKIITYILQGEQKVATSVLPPSIALNAAGYFKDDDLKLAKTHFENYLAKNELSQSNLPTIVVSYMANERNARIAELLQDMWHENLGLTVKLDGSEAKFFKQKVKEGAYMISLADWIADFQDPTSFLEIFKYKLDGTGGMNDTRWSNEKYNALLDLAVTENEKPKRNALLNEAESLLMEEMPVAPLYHYSFDYAKNKRVEGVILSPLGMADFKYTRIN